MKRIGKEKVMFITRLRCKGVTSSTLAEALDRTRYGYPIHGRDFIGVWIAPGGVGWHVESYAIHGSSIMCIATPKYLPPSLQFTLNIPGKEGLPITLFDLIDNYHELVPNYLCVILPELIPYYMGWTRARWTNRTSKVVITVGGYHYKHFTSIDKAVREWQCLKKRYENSFFFVHPCLSPLEIFPVRDDGTLDETWETSTAKELQKKLNR